LKKILSVQEQSSMWNH